MGDIVPDHGSCLSDFSGRRTKMLRGEGGCKEFCCLPQGYCEKELVRFEKTVPDIGFNPPGDGDRGRDLVISVVTKKHRM